MMVIIITTTTDRASARVSAEPVAVDPPNATVHSILIVGRTVVLVQ
jgi:hypothetical protein